MDQGHHALKCRQPIHQGRNDVLLVFLTILNLFPEQPEQFLWGDTKRQRRFDIDQRQDPGSIQRVLLLCR